MKVLPLAGTALWISTAPSLAAQTYNVLEDSSQLGFRAIGKPGFLKIQGEGGRLKGRLVVDSGTLKGDLTAHLSSLHSGVDLRDRHMHDKYLETSKHPTADLTLETLSFDKGTEGPCTFTGSLVLKAVKKPIRGSCEVVGMGKDALQVTAISEIKLGDYPIGVPTYLGVTLADKVTIEVEFSATIRPSS